MKVEKERENLKDKREKTVGKKGERDKKGGREKGEKKNIGIRRRGRGRNKE